MSFIIQNVAPIFVGLISGIAYGSSFLLQHRGIFSATPLRNTVRRIGFFGARIAIIFLAGQYLLRSALIPSILGSMAFFSMFWIMVLTVRAHLYERI